MAADTEKATKRAYGSGSLWLAADTAGRESWKGKWRTKTGVQVKRTLGPKRTPDCPHGLTKPQAERKLRTLMQADTTSSVDERVDIAELGRRYGREQKRKGLKTSTQEEVQSNLKTWLIPFFGTRLIDTFVTTDVEDLMVMMDDGERPDGKAVKPLTGKTIRNITGNLSAMLNFAVRKHLVEHNVAHEVDLPRHADYSDMRFLDADEVLLAANHVEAGPYQLLDRAAIVTAAMTGVRQGERIALRRRDVDWSANVIRVRRNYVRGEFTSTKGRTGRNVPMADQVAAILAEAFAASPCQDDDDLVFAEPVGYVEGGQTIQPGGPMSARQMLKRFHAALDAAGLERHRMHDLRHTFGTRMAAQGVSMRTLQEWMGHQHITTTERYAAFAPAPEHERAMIQAAFATTTAKVIVPPPATQPDEAEVGKAA